MKDSTTVRSSENQSFKMGIFEGDTKAAVDRSRRKGKWTERRRKPHVEQSSGRWRMKLLCFNTRVLCLQLASLLY